MLPPGLCSSSLLLGDVAVGLASCSQRMSSTCRWSMARWARRTKRTQDRIATMAVCCTSSKQQQQQQEQEKTTIITKSSNHNKNSNNNRCSRGCARKAGARGAFYLNFKNCWKHEDVRRASRKKTMHNSKNNSRRATYSTASIVLSHNSQEPARSRYSKLLM